MLTREERDAQKANVAEQAKQVRPVPGDVRASQFPKTTVPGNTGKAAGQTSSRGATDQTPKGVVDAGSPNQPPAGPGGGASGGGEGVEGVVNPPNVGPRGAGSSGSGGGGSKK
jgi:hypothetical protein